MKTLLIVLCAKYLIVLPILIAVVFLFKMRPSPHLQKQAAIMAAIILMLTYVAAKIAGLFYFDPRPFVVGNFTPLISHVADNGFPSDHTLSDTPAKGGGLMNGVASKAIGRLP